MIRGYDEGANITLLNVIYHKPKKNLEGKYDSGSLDIIFKDLDTGEKKMQHINDPDYIYYIANDGVPCTYNRLFIEKENVSPVKCKYREIKKSIAEITGNLDFFYDNLRNGNAKENDRLFSVKNIFNADMNIEDYYKFEFDKKYKNEGYTPDKLYFDIEVDGIDQKGDFPEMGECPVNAITLIHDGTKTVYTLLLENYKNPLIDEFKKVKDLKTKIKEFVKNSVGGWKQEIRYGLKDFDFKVMFYDEEINLLIDSFKIINTLKPDFALAWNIAFDLPYLIERIRTLGYSPEEIICHPDFKVKEAWYFIDTRAAKFEEHGDYAQISSYTVYLDQLVTFASRRKGQRINIPSYKLDDVGEAIANVNKLDYSHITTNIAQLPYLDYYTFVFYNIMDTIVQKCIEVKIGDVDFIFNKCLMNNTRYSKAHRQTVYLVNRGIKEFYKMGYIMGNNTNKHNEKSSFVGAFVSDPKKLSDKSKDRINDRPVNICRNLNDFDYKALYPSEISENNMSPNTMRGKIFFPSQLDPKENRFNNDSFDRTVWFIEDLVSNDRINFCNRYLNLAGYEQMYDDIIEYFSTVKNPFMGIRSTSLDGKIIMINNVTKDSKREMIKYVDNTQPYVRDMIIVQERMPEK